MLTLPKIQIYTDGACSGNPGPGGWGAYLIFDTLAKEMYGYEVNTTNNRMELTAAIEAIKALKYNSEIDIYTDSQYLKNGITEWITQWEKNNWHTSRKKMVRNVDLWQNLSSVIKIHKINWHWVKGHASNKGNIIADKLAVQGRDEALRRVQYGFH